MPLLFNLSKVGDRTRLKALLSREKPEIVDDYEEQLRELFGIHHPALVHTSGFENAFRRFLRSSEATKSRWQQGRWVYYPWLCSLVHVLPEADFFTVRTARNRNLITEEEQKKFYRSTIGIGGLSVGNSVALAIVLQGGARRIRLADHDRLALTNMNRIRTGVENLGLRKVEMTARQIYALNPYAHVELFPEGLAPGNIKRFFKGLDLVIDELDNLAVKCLIREEARRNRIAVIMAADNGDNGVVDIERYDLDPRTPFFHGRMGPASYKRLIKLTKFEIGRLITKHIGLHIVTPRMQASLVAMGKTIVSWPQLGGAALLNGSAVAYVARRILNGQPVEGDRALVSLDDLFIPGHSSPRSKEERKKAAKHFGRLLNLA